MSNVTRVTNKTRILESALQELAEKGFSGFTVQSVAARIDISLGNLTYHFPSREALIQSMLDLWFENWKQEFQTQIGNAVNRATPDIGHFIDWVMEQAVYPENVAIFTELWAYSNHDPKIASMMENLYSIAVSSVSIAFGLNPNDSKTEEFKSLLYLLAAVSEGSAAVLGNSSPQHPQRNILKENAKKLLEEPLRAALNAAI